MQPPLKNIWQDYTLQYTECAPNMLSIVKRLNRNIAAKVMADLNLKKQKLAFGS